MCTRRDEIVANLGEAVQQILKLLDMMQQSLYEATQQFIAQSRKPGLKWRTQTEHTQ